MSSASPQRRLTVAEMYFYTELRSSLGHMVAEHWLSGTSASCAGLRHVSPVANTPTAELPTKRRKNDQLEMSSSIQDSWSRSEASTPITADDTPRSLIRSFSSESLASIERFSSGVVNKCHGMVLKSRSMSLSFLVRKHGDKAGLLFTDAAHELLDYSSPIVSRSCSDLSRCCSSEADPKVSEYESDPSLWHVASWCYSARRSSRSNNDCFVGLIVLIVVLLLSIILGFRV